MEVSHSARSVPDEETVKEEMKTIRTIVLAGTLFILTIGVLASPNVVFNLPNGADVQPDLYGTVYVRATATDPAGIIVLSLDGPDVSAVLYPSYPVRWAFIAYRWDVRELPIGEYTFTALAVNNLLESTTKTLTLHLTALYVFPHAGGYAAHVLFNEPYQQAK